MSVNEEVVLMHKNYDKDEAREQKPSPKKKKRRFSLGERISIAIDIVRFWAAEHKAKDDEYKKRVALKNFSNGEAPKIKPVLDDVVITPDENAYVMPRICTGQVWKRQLMDSVEYKNAIKTIYNGYLESQGVKSIRHADVMRIAEHVIMRIFVEAKMMTEAEYETWYNLK